MADWITDLLTYAETEPGERAIKVGLAVLAALGTVLLWFFGVIQKVYAKFSGKQDQKGDPSPTYDIHDSARVAVAGEGGVAAGSVAGDQIVNQGAPAGHVLLTSDQFVEHLERERSKTETQLRTAHDNEKAQLRQRIEELERQLSDPGVALRDAQRRIDDLQAKLERFGNDIGAERLDAARTALANLDYSVADEIFAEIEARQEIEVQQAARAAYGRGEIAEAEVRWTEAADHYARAARLVPDFSNLYSAREFAWRSGRYQSALRLGEDLLTLARDSGDQRDIATALNEHASTLAAMGCQKEAETHYREALEIDRKTIGTDDPAYATRLSNLALMLDYMGRYEEAEPYYREALEIDRKTIGTEHPAHAVHLNNLALLLNVTDRHEEAEPLYREALRIDRKTIGAEHPDYAVHLTNLAGLLRFTGRYEEAEPLYREALEIDRKTIGTEHPDYARDLNNLALLLQATGRHEEAESFYREAVVVVERALGADHPNSRTVRENLEQFLAHMRRAGSR